MPVLSGKIQNMSSVMEELLAGSDLERLKEGAIVSGLVTEIRQNEVVVDVGGKSEGTIFNVEFVDTGDLEIGIEIEVLLERLEGPEGSPILSLTKLNRRKIGRIFYLSVRKAL